jgi:hypothetical protein
VREIHDRAETTIDADANALFTTVTDLERLPDWNKAIERVIDRPRALTAGASWTVQMRPSRLMRWKSVSTLSELDGEARRFSYRTVNADGNPSYALWEWEVTRTADRVQVSVSWDVFLETLDRRLLAGPIRRRQLRREVADSLSALGRLETSPAR